MTGIGESVDVSVRSAPKEVGEEAIMEDGIPPSPDQQHGNAALFKRTECFGCTPERGCRWVRGPNGDIGDESSDSASAPGSDVWGVERFTMDSISHPGSAAHEQWSLLTGRLCRGSGDGDERRDANIIGLGDSSVGENHCPQIELAGSTHSDSATPVMGDEHKGPVDL